MTDTEARDLLVSLEEARATAMRAADLKALDAMMDERVAYGHSNSLRDSKETYLEGLSSGEVRYQQLQFTHLEVTTAQDDLLIGTGRMRADIAKEGGLVKAHSTYLAVWQRQAGQWKLLAFQGTRIPA